MIRVVEALAALRDWFIDLLFGRTDMAVPYEWSTPARVRLGAHSYRVEAEIEARWYTRARLPGARKVLIGRLVFENEPPIDRRFLVYRSVDGKLLVWFFLNARLAAGGINIPLALDELMTRGNRQLQEAFLKSELRLDHFNARISSRPVIMTWKGVPLDADHKKNIADFIKSAMDGGFDLSEHANPKWVAGEDLQAGDRVFVDADGELFKLVTGDEKLAGTVALAAKSGEPVVLRSKT